MSHRRNNDSELWRWLTKLRLWIAKLLGGQRHQYRNKVQRVFPRKHISLLLLEADYSDDQFERVRCWRGILRQEVWYDVLLTLDRIRYLPRRSTPTTTEKPRFNPLRSATHRITVTRHSRSIYARQAKAIRTDCLFMVDCCLVDSYSACIGMDGNAPRIFDSLAFQLTHREPEALKLLLEFENESGIEVPGERERIWHRWGEVLKIYILEYIPTSSFLEELIEREGA